MGRTAEIQNCRDSDTWAEEETPEDSSPILQGTLPPPHIPMRLDGLDLHVLLPLMT
jgi:hypothetical protein